MTDIVEDNGDGDKPAADPFNLARLREPQSLAQVRKRRLNVPVRRKPNRLDFVRTHPDPDYRVNMPLFSLRSDSGGDEETYFIKPEFLSEMKGEYRMCTIFTR